MLSKFTKPGTKIVCTKFTVHPDCQPYVGKFWAPITIGQEYTLREITCHQEPHRGDVFLVLLDGITNPTHPVFKVEFGYNLQDFRVRDLPECLTRLLVGQGVKITEDA